MIHDIAPHRYDVAYKKPKVKGDDVILTFRENKLLCYMEDTQIFYPTVGEMLEQDPDIYKKIDFLFGIDNINYYKLREQKFSEFGKWKYLEKQKLRNVRPIWKAFAGITGFQIHKWHMEAKFCGCCGAKMKLYEKERAMQCPECGRISYPQICPSVIVGVINGSQILMTKYAENHSNFKKYALVAGYVEIGESLEDTVRREVMEEVGLRVKNIRYYKSQPWSFSDALLAGFFCEVDGDTQITMDKGELSAAEWFDRESLPAERSESSISLTGEMIEAFRQGQI